MPGMAEEMDGAMQQAPQLGRHFILLVWHIFVTGIGLLLKKPQSYTCIKGKGVGSRTDRRVHFLYSYKENEPKEIRPLHKSA